MNIFKKVGLGILKGADKTKGVIPFAAEIDTIADLAQGITTRTKADKEKLGSLLAGLKELKAGLQPVGTVEHKRLKVAVLNAMAVGIIYLGFPPEVADEIAMYVSGPATAFILGDTWRPSAK